MINDGSGLHAEVMEKTVWPGLRSLRFAGSAALALTVAVILLFWFRGDQESWGIRVTTLNVANGVAYGVISPDGKYVAYVSFDYPGESVWVREVNANGRGIRVAGVQGGLWGLSYLVPSLKGVWYRGHYCGEKPTLYHRNPIFNRARVFFIEERRPYTETHLPLKIPPAIVTIPG